MKTPLPSDEGMLPTLLARGWGVEVASRPLFIPIGDSAVFVSGGGSDGRALLSEGGRSAHGGCSTDGGANEEVFVASPAPCG